MLVSRSKLMMAFVGIVMVLFGEIVVAHKDLKDLKDLKAHRALLVHKVFKDP